MYLRVIALLLFMISYTIVIHSFIHTLRDFVNSMYRNSTLEGTYTADNMVR